MTSIVNHVVRPIFVAILACALGGMEQGCTPNKEPAQYVPTAQDGYVARIFACRSLSATKAEALDCRKRLNQEYGLCDEPSEGIPCP